MLSSFTNDPTVQLAFIGANGTLGSVNLAQAAGYVSGSPVFSLAKGSYTLAVSSTSPTATPSYGFSLYDMSTAQALTAGTAASGTLQPNQAVAAYTISAAAGTQLRIFTTRDNQGYADQILVFDANGKPLAPPQSYYNGAAVFQIATTGSYTMLFEGVNYVYGQVPSVNYTLTAYVDPAPTPLVIDAATDGTLVDQNAVGRYTFTLATDTSLVFNSLTPDGNQTWTLTGPNGFSLNRNLYYSGSYEFGGANPILALKAGTFTVTFATSNSAGGSYNFNLPKFADSTALTLGKLVGNPDTVGNGTFLYSVDATAGAPFNLTVSDSSNVLSKRLFDPYGQEVFGPTQTGQQLVTPTVTGRYTVMVEGRVYDGTPRPFTIRADSAPQQTFALAGPNGLSGMVGPFSQAGQIGKALAFTGLDSIQVADEPALDLGGSFTLQAWINPDRIDATNVPIITKSGGRNYTYALGMNSGDQIWLQFSDANNNNIVYTTYGVAPGNAWTQVTGVVDSVAHTMTIYINVVQAVQQSFNAYTPVDSGSPLVIAADQPLGAFGDGAFQGLIQQVAVWNVARDASDILASYNAVLTGTESGLVLYLPLLDPSGSTTVADKGPNAVTASVIHAFAGLNNVVEGRIPAPFGTDTYTFTLSQTKTFVIDGLTDDDAFSVTLTGPNGLSITRNIARSDSFEIGGNDAFTSGPGNYKMVVSATTGHIGSFGFRLLELSTATPMSLNTPVNFTLPAGFATQALSFTGNAGDQLIFDSLALPVSSDLVSIRIIDPLGRLLAGPLSCTVETGIPIPPVTGSYILLIEGRTFYDRNGPLQLGFALDRTVTNPFTLQIDAPNPKLGPLWGAGLTAGHGLTFTGADEATVPDNAVTAQTNCFTIDAMVKLTRFDGHTPIATKVAAVGSSGGGTRAFASTGLMKRSGPRPLLPQVFALLVEGWVDGGSAAQALTVRADKVVNGANTTTLGSQIDAVLTTPGQQQLYTFTITNPGNVLIDPLGYDGRFYYTLTYPNGSTVTRPFNNPFYNSHYDSNPLLFLGPGQYTLAIGPIRTQPEPRHCVSSMPTRHP